MTAADVLLAYDAVVRHLGLELFLPLIVGARLVLVTREDAADGDALARCWRKSGATVMQATPATWRLLLEAGWRGDGRACGCCAAARRCRGIWPTRLLERGAELWNMYGPTETTIWSTVQRVERGEAPVIRSAGRSPTRRSTSWTRAGSRCRSACRASCTSAAPAWRAAI